MRRGPSHKAARNSYLTSSPKDLDHGSTIQKHHHFPYPQEAQPCKPSNATESQCRKLTTLDKSP